MSARRVCSGTRPSRYHSVRLISAPPRRPEHCTRMPRAPAFCAFCTARFMARRKATRPASWSATPWAISAASSSGCLISWMLSWTLLLPVILASSARRRSASAPRRPMTMPGRAVCTSMRRRSRVRSTSMRLIAACGRSPMSLARIFQSSMTKSAYSVRLANQRDFQSVVTPEAEPVGIDLLTHLLLFLAASDSASASSDSALVCSRLSVLGGSRSLVDRAFGLELGFGLFGGLDGGLGRLTGDRAGLLGLELAATSSSVTGSSVLLVTPWASRLRATRARRSALAPPRRRARPAAAGVFLACWSCQRRRASSSSRLTMTVMWQVRLRMRVARPRARGRQRLRVGPSSA